MNDPELVEKLGNLLNVDLDAVVSLNNTDGEKLINIQLLKFYQNSLSPLLSLVPSIDRHN